MKLTIEVSNFTQTAQALASLGPKAMAGAVEAALEEADFILGKALHIVPFKTGALSGTGRVEEVENDAGELTAAVAFGDEAVDYALAVHENLEANYSPPGEAKYLENPANEEMSSGRSVARMQATIVAAIEGVGGGGRFAKRSAAIAKGMR